MPGLIQLPAFGAVKGAKGFLGDADWSFDHDETVVRFYPRWSWMQPWLLAALAAWGLEARDRGVQIRVENGETGAYAWRFGLADYLYVRPTVTVTPHEETGRFVALRTITNPAEHAKLMGDVVTLLHLSAEPEQAKAVQYVLSELLRNVREHSGSSYGAVVAAQYYPGIRGPRYVSVGVADTGVGVRETLARNYPVPDDQTAVRLATNAGVSGAVPGMYGASDNAGAGLFYTRRLAEASQAYFAIASGSAMFRTSVAARRPPDENLVFDIAPYPGTIVCANFSLEEEVDFDDFLGVTGRAFSRLDEALRSKILERVRFG